MKRVTTCMMTALTAALLAGIPGTAFAAPERCPSFLAVRPLAEPVPGLPMLDEDNPIVTMGGFQTSDDCSKPELDGVQNPGKPDSGSAQNPGKPDSGSAQNPGKPDSGSVQNPGKPESGCIQNPGNPIPGGTQKPEDVQKPGISQAPDTEKVPDTEDSEILDEFAMEVAELVNQERVKAGLSPLTIDSSAAAAAQTRAMEIEQSFSHTRPDGRSFSTALTEAGVSYRSSGENIAYGQKTPSQVMESWMNSAGHRANILNESYTAIGVGHYQNQAGVSYWTQLFIG